MTTALPAIASDPWFIAGWTMVHFLWLGTMVAAIALAGRIVLRSANPNVCYAFALGCLALIAALPIGTATWLVARDGNDNEGLAPLRFAAKPDPAPPITSPNRRDAERSTPATPSSPHTTAPPTIELHVPEGSPPVVVMQPREVVPAAPNEPSFATANSEQPSPSQQRSGNLLAVLVGVIPYLPWVWIIGTPLTFALLATGLLGSRRLRKASRPIQNGPAAELLAHLTLSLRITREITLAACERVAAPVLIGILRPIILLPPAALTGWSPDELEMVLLHELAHVRRYDNLVNFVQRVIESLLFFHPAVWSLSAWVRREREACCDAAVIHRTHKPHAYAELLLNLAATHQPLAGLAIPFSRHPLHTRIRHILQLEEDPMLISGKSFTAIAATLLIIIASAVFYWPPARATEPQPTATPPSKSTPVNREEPPFSRDVERSEPATPANSKFPTSEEQKLSTHVFNRLGMELETLGEEDLKRVKSMGYEGGVKIAIAPQHERSNRNIRFAYGSIQEGDLLVGLHVWPTTSLQDVLTILDRDDLNEFNPMKFYVVRDGSRQPSGSPPVSGDIVEVGRISIPAAPKREQTRESPTPTENTPSNPSATQSQSPPTDSTPALQAPSPSPGKAPKSPSTYDPRPSTAPDRPSAINKESLRYNGKPFQEWQQLWRTELSTENRLEAVKAIAAFGRAGYGEEAVESILDIAGEYDFYVLKGGAERDPEDSLKQAVLNTLAPYNTFDPNLFSQPLATRWIVSISNRKGEDEEKWKWLATQLFSRLNTDDPDVMSLLRSFAANPESKLQREALSALLGISTKCAIRGKELDEPTRAAIEKALEENNPEIIRLILSRLIVNVAEMPLGGGMMPPAKLQLLCRPKHLAAYLVHAEDDVCGSARKLLPHLNQKDAEALIAQLEKVEVPRDSALANEAQLKILRRNQLHVLRAFAALGPKGKPALPEIAEVLQHETDRPTLIAAIVALTACSDRPLFKSKDNQRVFNVEGYAESFDSLDKNRLTANNATIQENMSKNLAEKDGKLFDDLTAEAYEIFPADDTQNLGGGGFF